MPVAARSSRILPLVFLSALVLPLTGGLSGCTVGPDHVRPVVAAPDSWTAWRSSDPSLRTAIGTQDAIPQDWWTLFEDPVLNDLEARALAASPDLETAALHFAQARVQREGAGAAGLPQVNARASATRQRLSENGASTRLFDVIGGADRDTLAKFLANPFTLYQGGFDAGWEPDLWGKVHRSLEAADARVAQQRALLDLARLTVTSELARAYFQLRATQAQIALAEEDLAVLDTRAEIVGKRVAGGLDDHTAVERERSAREALRASLPQLRAAEGQLINALSVLAGEHPGALAETLARPQAGGAFIVPDLSLGMPSHVALARPDVQAAEANLRAATAAIGVAVADLYPSIRLGGGFNLESYRSQNLFDWASRTWQIGPSLNLPIFDGGHRRAVVAVRKLEQREAIVNFQKTVLAAWQEIDDALSGYAADQQQHAALRARLESARRTRALVKARYDAGAVNYLPVLDASRAVLQAERELAENEGQLRARFAAVNKAIGNAPAGPSPHGGAATSR